MADFPSNPQPFSPILTPCHEDSTGDTYQITVLGDAASASWTVANKALFYPFRLSSFAVAYQMLWWVGASSAGNIDVGIYAGDGKTRIVSAGSTAMSATVNTIQELNITDTVLPPGDYYLAGACDSTSGTCFRATSAADENVLASQPIYEQTGLTAAALPAAATPVYTTDTAASVWVIGVQLRSVF